MTVILNPWRDATMTDTQRKIKVKVSWLKAIVEADEGMDRHDRSHYSSR